jgi:hypothetical protein
MTFIDSCVVRVDHAEFPAAAKRLRELVEAGAKEPELQKHLERNLYLVSQQFAHCHHVAPHFLFGRHFCADFMCLDYPSHWPHWIAVEIESPSKKLVTQAGRRTAELEHALQQIRDWREFVKNNLDFVNKPKEKDGLGLEFAEPTMTGYVFIGRRSQKAEEIEKLNIIRNQIRDADNIHIHTWDHFVERAEQRAQCRPFVLSTGAL